MKPVAISLTALIALAILVVLALLSGHSAVGSAPVQARHVPPVVSRSVQRPWLTLVPSVAPATAQVSSPSASASNGAVRSRRSVATVGPVVGKGKPSAGPTNYEALRARIEFCESRNDPRAVNKASGASGAWQFLDSTWRSVTGLPGKASDYPLDVQTEAFDALYAASGTAPWASSRSCWQ